MASIRYVCRMAKIPAFYLITGLITALLGSLLYVNYYYLPDAAIEMLLVIPVLLTLFYKTKKSSFYVTIICSLLTIPPFWTSNLTNINFINFIISLTGIWVAYFFILKLKNYSFSESKNKERLNALFEYATEGMVIANSAGEIVMINPIAETQFGYDKGELNGKRIEALLPDRVTERHVKHREKYSQNPYPRPMGKGNMLYGKRKNGSEFPVEISLTNFTTDEGNFAIAFIIDISERKKAEDLIQKEKEIAQMYLDIAPVIFIVLTKNQQVSLINQNGCQILGFSENEIIGKNWFDGFVETTQRENYRNLFVQLMEDKKSAIDKYENEIVTASGEKRMIAWKNTIIRDAKGQPLATLSAGEDVTESRNQEIRLIQANQELKQYSDQILKLNSELEKRVQERTEELAELINKLEHINGELAIEVKERRQAEIQLEKKREELKIALEHEKVLGELKSRFVTMASHEFRTPLSTILSSASLISKYTGIEQEDKRTKHIERIKSSVSNLTSILNDFLSIGKLEEGKVQCSPSAFDIVSFSNELVNELKELTQKGQTISYQHTGMNFKVVLDKNLTRNICINLLSNAIKYSGEGKSVQFHTQIENDQLKISVTDNGIGIPLSEQVHIFKRFFRANNASNIQGTGLGLNIVKKYVELMDGDVSFESEFEKGTCFTVVLPVKLEEEC
jgi:PAS domain S-box-containing protein